MMKDSLFHGEKFKAVPATARIVFLELAMTATRIKKNELQPGMEVSESYKEIQRNTGFSSGTVARALRYLENSGLIEKLPDKNAGAHLTLRPGNYETTGRYRICQWK